MKNPSCNLKIVLCLKKPKTPMHGAHESSKTLLVRVVTKHQAFFAENLDVVSSLKVASMK